MIQASCPSCGAPLVFAHGDALTAACGQCQSLVVRADRDVRAVGKVSAFDRDLSPVQLDASGVAGKRRFRVVGVVRLGRERVRWNEWALLFDDGGTGWLGESNGQHWLFEGEGDTSDAERRLAVGDALRRPDGTWIVLEVGVARIVAAEGSLTWAAPPTLTRPYADLRRVGGGVGTLDLEDPHRPTFFAGRVTTLVELRMEGLRPVTGWSDPALTHFRGAELHNVRKLDCGACGATLDVKAANLSERVVCAYCGTATDLDDPAAPVDAAARSPRPLWEPALPLGTRGRLNGVDWQIVGAMERSVRVEGVRYPWTEYFLYNPWRGGLWLVEANGHWSKVELLGELPEASESAAAHGGAPYRAFQGGSAKVDRVLGEFTWQVAVGDLSRTRDYVRDGWMLSREDADGERTWSLGEYLAPEEVERFAKRSLPRPRGVAPHQPNPHTGAAFGVNLAMSAGLVALVIAGYVLLHLASAEEVTTLRYDGLSTGAVAVAEFTVPDVLRRDTSLALACDDGSAGSVVSLIHQPTGAVYEQSFTGNASPAKEWRLEPGAYTARLELAASAQPSVSCTLRLTRDNAPGPPMLALLAAGLAFALPLWRRSAFEQKRWEESSFA